MRGAIQRGLAQREPSVPEGDRIRLRISVNLGEVIVDGEDIYGDGVNVASRLEAVAEPGASAFRAKYREELRKRLELLFAPMGSQRVKNLSEPVDAWRVVLDDSGTAEFVGFHERRGALARPWWLSLRSSYSRRRRCWLVGAIKPTGPATVRRSLGHNAAARQFVG